MWISISISRFLHIRIFVSEKLHPQAGICILIRVFTYADICIKKIHPYAVIRAEEANSIHAQLSTFELSPQLGLPLLWMNPQACTKSWSKVRGGSNINIFLKPLVHNFTCQRSYDDVNTVFSICGHFLNCFTKLCRDSCQQYVSVNT